MDFHVGEKVIYPNHGIGVIESIQQIGGASGVYVLRLLSNNSRVWVSRENAAGVGLRSVSTAADVRRVYSLLGDGTIEQQSNWKGRFKENSDKMRTGSIYEVAGVLKGLTFLSRKKALSFREKRMLDRAKFLIVSEIAEVEGKSLASVEERVDKALAKTFSVAVVAKPVAKKPVQTPVGAQQRRSDA